VGLNVGQTGGGIAQLLLQHGARVSIQNRRGDTPLHYAVLMKNVTVSRILLEHGANANEKNRDEKTPLQIASESKQTEIIQLLSEHGGKSSG